MLRSYVTKVFILLFCGDYDYLAGGCDYTSFDSVYCLQFYQSPVAFAVAGLDLGDCGEFDSLALLNLYNNFKLL